MGSSTTRPRTWILGKDTFVYSVLFILVISTILNFYVMAYRLDVKMTSKANTHRRSLVMSQLLLPVVICITSFVIILVPNSGKFPIGRPMTVNSYSLTLKALYLDFARLIYFSFALRSMFDLIIGMIFFLAEQSDFQNSPLDALNFRFWIFPKIISVDWQKCCESQKI